MKFLIQHYLKYNAAQIPNNIAFECLDRQVNYHQLETMSNQLANCLIDKGVGKGDRVGIYMDKCLEISYALYGILKAGAAYVPLDPSAPAARLAEIILDCGINVVISNSNKTRRLQQIQQHLRQNYRKQDPKLLSVVIGVEEQYNEFSTLAWQDIFSQYTKLCPVVKLVESDLAYIIYTSGSTGKPKGIMHTHHSCLNYARWAANEYQLCATDRLGNHSPLHFDISIFDLFAGGVAGSCTIIIPEEYTKFPASYSQLIADSKMTVLFTVPFALVQLAEKGVLQDRDMTALRWIIFGGEPFPIKYLHQLKSLLPLAKLDNMYGPAEVNGCTHFTVTKIPVDALAIPIGRICDIAQSLIVDESFNPVEVDEVGELLIRTPTMMQGYWGRQELNRMAFYRVNVNDAYSQVFYRSGDLVKQDKNGLLWFIGRKDRQIKVRGYRVELDEIEAVLLKRFDVAEAAVLSFPHKDGTTEIRAAYIPKKGTEPQLNSVKRSGLLKHLKAHLPSYAIPSEVLMRENFPRTTTGKIDRTALSLKMIAEKIEVTNGTN